MADTDYLNLSLGDRLVNVRRAIDKAENAQSYKISDREATRANIDSLYTKEAELLKKIAKLEYRDVVMVTTLT